MIVGVDQVLLDLVVNVDDDPTVFERYGLQRNTQCLAEAKHEPLVRDLVARAEVKQSAASASEGCCFSCFEGLGLARPAAGRGKAGSGLPAVKTSPGGVVSNALRAAAWLLRQRGCMGGPRVPALVMMGMVGRDKTAERLRTELRATGVEPMLDVLPEDAGKTPGSMAALTGVCCCLIAGKERTMVAELGAGRTLELHGKKAPSFPGWPERIAAAERVATAASSSSAPTTGGSPPTPQVVITGAFYVLADPEGSRKIRDWCAASPSRLLLMTVAAEWCCHQAATQEIARDANFMFGNEAEMLELAKALADAGNGPKPGDFEAAIALIARWKGRGWVIATRGARSVVASHAGSSEPMLHVPVTKVPPEEFIDDVGAGDSFMGGFAAVLTQRLAALPQAELAKGVAGDAVKEAIVGGTLAAAACVRSMGCQFKDP